MLNVWLIGAKTDTVGCDFVVFSSSEEECFCDPGLCVGFTTILTVITSM